MKNAEFTEATSWLIPDFEDATGVAHEKTKKRMVDKLCTSGNSRPDLDQIKFFTNFEFPG